MQWYEGKLNDRITEIINRYKTKVNAFKKESFINIETYEKTYSIETSTMNW